MAPQDLKPALCVLNPDDVYNLRKNNANDSYYCVTPYEVLELKSQGVSFPYEPHLQEGLVLTREAQGCGYYFRTDETDCRIINERCFAIEAILSYLGGKDFRYSETSSFRSKESLSVNVGAGVKKSGNELGIESSVNKGHQIGNDGEKALKGEWRSGNYTIEGYRRAVELAKVNGLINDPTIATLLEQRQPGHPNPIKSQEYHINVTADLDNNIHVLTDIRANLKDKIGGELKVDVNASRKVDQASTVDFFVSFGPIPIEVSQKAIEDDKRQKSKKLGTKWIWPAIAIAMTIIAIASVLFYLFH